MPGAELVLRVHDIAPSPDTLIVVNCAGRTRSIIGAQSLINAGVPNKVVALRNGTMGWHLAGLTCDHGKDNRAPAVSGAGLAWAKSKADEVARRFGIARIDRAALERWRADTARTLYIFDVRDPAEYEAGHFPGALSAPGGQLVQATDQYAGTLGARIVLSDDNEVRAVMTASWLKQMGWKDVAVLPEAGTRDRQPADIVLGAPPADAAVEFSDVLAIDNVNVIDLSRSPNYRKGHIPGAWFAIRSRLDRALPNIPLRSMVVLTSEDGVLAGLAVEEARALTTLPVRWLKGGNAAWAAAGFPLSTDAKMADEPVDVWLKPYERPGDPKAAMNEYLSWEIDLLSASSATARRISARQADSNAAGAVHAAIGYIAAMKFLDEAKVYVQLRRGRQRLHRVPAREVHRVRRPERRRRRQGRRRGDRGGGRPQHPDRLPLPAALQGRSAAATAWARTATAPTARTWC